jgi:DNA-binding XRE family transcriptional regulator
MGGLVHAKTVKGKKVWYVWGARGNDKWERAYPQCGNEQEFYDTLREELGLDRLTPKKEVVFALFHKTWIENRWEDDFILRLKALREERNLTQDQLAEEAGLSLPTISALEQGQRAPSWDTVLRLAKALGVDPNEFCVSPPEKK